MALSEKSALSAQRRRAAPRRNGTSSTSLAAALHPRSPWIARRRPARGGNRMNRDDIKGKAEKAKGYVKEEAGELLNKPDLEAEGEMDQAKGDAREAAGRAKRKIGEGIEELGEKIK